MQKFRHTSKIILINTHLNIIISLNKKFLLSVVARETYIFPFLSQNIQIFKIGVIYHHRGFSPVHSSTKLHKLILSFIHSLSHNSKILKFFFLTQNFFSLWWACVRWCKTFSFSLSQSFFSLCNLPHQRKVSTQLQTGYNGSQRVTTG